MAIKINTPAFLTKKGKRKNNQDSIYPVSGAATIDDKLFLVCDGVGGANKGEVASRMVCDLFHEYFRDFSVTHVDSDYINAGLQFVESKLLEHVQQHPECLRMATTLTLIYLDPVYQQATIAWVGDSRVYHVREGQILYQTDDHSLVNELVKRGEITEEEARIHPQKNIILRAVSAETPTTADVKFITDLQEGDYFLLATDGIIEGVDDRLISELLKSKSADLDQVVTSIDEFCENGSKDNYSMYLLQVNGFEEEAIFDGGTNTAKLNIREEDETPSTTIEKSQRNLVFGIGMFALVFLVGLGIYKWFSLKQEKYQYYQKVMQRADDFYKAEKLDSALSIYNDAVKAYPDSARVIASKIDQVKATIQEKETQKISEQEEELRTKIVDLLIRDDGQRSKNDSIIITDSLPYWGKPELEEYIQKLSESIEKIDSTNKE